MVDERGIGTRIGAAINNCFFIEFLNMRYFLALICTIFCTGSTAQSYFRIKDSGKVFRFYHGTNNNREKLNSRYSIKIEKVGDTTLRFEILDLADSVLDSCSFRRSGKFTRRRVTTRLKKGSSTSYTSNNVKVECLLPVDRNCINYYLNYQEQL